MTKQEVIARLEQGNSKCKAMARRAARTVELLQLPNEALTMADLGRWASLDPCIEKIYKFIDERNPSRPWEQKQASE
jgi:hypothetical protein